MKTRINNKDSKKKIRDNTVKVSSEKTSENHNLKYLFYLIVLVLPLFTAYYYYETAFSTYQVLSFPLDDPWIHLTFAKNIVEYFSFSYYKNEIVTAGSTSPLYVFIAAAGFLITNNEMILSYVLGTLFFALSSFFFYKIALKEFSNDILLSLLVCFVYIFDYWMNFIAVSGMETTLFILLIILGVYLYKTKKTVLLGIVLGLLIWTRPDGIALVAALILDQIYLKWIIKEKDKSATFSPKEIFMLSGIFLAFLLSYFALNLYLSGTLLSNTYSAKIAHNTETDTRIRFLTFHIWNFFTDEHYKFLIPGFIVSTALLIIDLAKRKYNQITIYVIFVFIFILIYLIKLPMFSRFGRYFMPMLPFYILSSMYGYYAVFKLTKAFIKKTSVIKITIAATFLFILVYTFFSFQSYSKYYAFCCKYVYDRHVKTSYWFRDNTTDSDIIAAHDIGAIGFYAKRKIVDIAGLINPDLVKESYKENYNEIITEYFKKNGVTYITFYREWFMIKNQNPVFNSTEDKAPEAMYVYKFYPDKTKILPRKMNYLLGETSKYFNENSGDKLVSSMDEILKTEPDFALAYFYKAIGYHYMKDMDKFEENINKAILLFPDFKDALTESGKFSLNKGNMEDAKLKFKKILELEPNNAEAKNFLNQTNSLSVQK